MNDKSCFTPCISCQEKDKEIERLKEINSKFKFYGTDGCTKCETGRITLYHTTNECILCEQREALAGGKDES